MCNTFVMDPSGVSHHHLHPEAWQRYKLDICFEDVHATITIADQMNTLQSQPNDFNPNIQNLNYLPKIVVRH